MKVKLGDVFERQITGEWGNECSENEPGAKVLRTTNFTSSGEIDFKNVVMRSINKSKVQSKRLHYGDIILEKSGGTEKTPVGRVVFCDESIENDIYLCNNFTQTMRANQVVGYPRYVFYFMWYLHYSGKTDLLQNKTTGILNLQLKSYLNEELPLPSLDEQRRIAAVLDKVSDLIVKRRAQLDKLDELVKARFVEMFGDFKLNTKKWPVVSFDEIAIIDGNMTTDYEKYANYPHIGIDSIEKETGALKGYRTVAEDGVISGKYVFTPKHIIYSKIRPNLNKVALPDFEGVCSADAYPILPIEGKCNRVFLAYDMRSQFFLDYILQFCNRTNLPKVNRTEVAGFKTPLPPVNLQNDFADFVTLAEKSKLTIQQSLDKLEILKKALMQEYFG